MIARTDQLGTLIGHRVRGAIVRSQVGALLVSQAKRRIRARGDSLTRYPDLWDGGGKSYRAGGVPLRDTGRMVNGLHSDTQESDSGATVRLLASDFHAIYHQTGYKTTGPNFIPLTLAAKRNYTIFKAITTRYKGASKAEKVKMRAELKDAGFIEGETYIMAWGGVTVPARPIFNLPPEDIAEIRDALSYAMKTGLR